MITLGDKFRQYFKIEFLVLLIVFLILVSPIMRFTVNSLADADYNVNRQRGIYDAMIWLRENTPNDSVIISVSRWEFKYVKFLIGKRFLGDYYIGPDELYRELESLSRYKNIYVVVWNLVKNENNTFPLVDLYLSDKRFKFMFSNDIVTIFRVIL